jgi:hypothetical protein
MSSATTTRISADGLRYTSRVPGTPFAAAMTTRSCFKCGRHRPLSDLQSKRLLGRIEMVCKPKCQPD